MLTNSDETPPDDGGDSQIEQIRQVAAQGTVEEQFFADDGSLQLADGMATKYRKLPPQFVVFERRTGYIGSVVLAGIMVSSTSPLFVFALERLWVGILIPVVWLIITVGLFWSSLVWPPIKHRHIAWKLDARGFEIKRGVWWRHQIAVPVARVQHVDVSQGPIQRLFELATLTIHTAGTSNAVVVLEGLGMQMAEQVRDVLIARKESLDAQ